MKISAKQYAQALHELTDGKKEAEISGIIVDYIAHVKKNGDLKIANEIIVQYEEIYNRANGIVSATVTSAFPLSADQKTEIEKFIKKEYSADEVSAMYKEDDGVKGGIVIRVGDEVLDASINGRLQAVRRALINN